MNTKGELFMEILPVSYGLLDTFFGVRDFVCTRAFNTVRNNESVRLEIASLLIRSNGRKDWYTGNAGI